jgi:hypothetical protein
MYLGHLPISAHTIRIINYALIHITYNSRSVKISEATYGEKRNNIPAAPSSPKKIYVVPTIYKLAGLYIMYPSFDSVNKHSILIDYQA